MKKKTDYDQEDWCGSTEGSPRRFGASSGSSSLPMPTLYSNEGQKKPKPSLVELVLYNLGSMLAGVASGYDVKKSNELPVHPKLRPQNFPDENKDIISPVESEFIAPERVYSHNTYHGPVRHSRYFCIFW